MVRQTKLYEWSDQRDIEFLLRRISEQLVKGFEIDLSSMQLPKRDVFEKAREIQGIVDEVDQYER